MNMQIHTPVLYSEVLLLNYCIIIKFNLLQIMLLCAKHCNVCCAGGISIPTYFDEFGLQCKWSDLIWSNETTDYYMIDNTHFLSYSI